MSSYQVIHFKSKIPKIFFLSSKEDLSLHFHKNLALVFKNGYLYFCQEIDYSNSKDEVKEFLKKILKLENLKIVQENKFISKNKHNFIKVKNSNILKFFLLYFLIICSIFYFLDFSKNKQQNIIENIRTNTKQIEFDTRFKFVSEEVLNLFSLSKKHLVKVLKINFVNSKFVFEIESMKKENIYSFFKSIEKAKVENISYDDQRKVYIANATFKIHRK